jgi:hypothetical protein
LLSCEQDARQVTREEPMAELRWSRTGIRDNGSIARTTSL